MIPIPFMVSNYHLVDLGQLLDRLFHHQVLFHTMLQGIISNINIEIDINIMILCRLRVENMERQLANLTGLVQKALTQPTTHLQVPGRDNYRAGICSFRVCSVDMIARVCDELFVLLMHFLLLLHIIIHNGNLLLS